MRRGTALGGLFGIALLLVPAAGSDAVAQSSRSRSDMLFEPWKAAPHRGAPPSLTRERLGRADMGQGVAAPGEDTFGGRRSLPSHLRRQTVDYPTSEPASTIIVDTANTYLYFVLGNGQAIRYGIGVGREGFTWSGRERVTRMAEWPNWRPPADMVARSPDLPDFVPGGLDNPLGARALYLGDTLYRIHGTNEPSSIGTFASSGCIRMLNADVIDLYRRVSVGTRVVVLANHESTRTR
jgi:lipoprotein-anchoring transpeptidase ErfK/SrfK